jgi:hypothetical protein
VRSYSTRKKVEHNKVKIADTISDQLKTTQSWRSFSKPKNSNIPCVIELDKRSRPLREIWEKLSNRMQRLEQ